MDITRRKPILGKYSKGDPTCAKKRRLRPNAASDSFAPERPQHTINSYDSSKTHIITSAENSLKELDTDYLDLLLIHRPDFLMNPHEIAAAFEHLAKAGKVRHFGVSNFTASQMDMLSSFTCLVNNQVEISLLKLDAFTDGTLDKCQQHKIMPTAWSPLGRGKVFGKSDDPKILRVQIKAGEIADKYNTSMDQILLAFLLKHPAGITPVLGTSKIERIKTALNAKAIKITQEDWYALWKASTGKEIA